MAEATPALEIRNLHKRYGDLEVLKTYLAGLE